MLLDEPYPQTLPVVSARAQCNASFSLDEQYLACFVECVIHGTVEPERLERAKVRRILRENTKLQCRILGTRKEEDGSLVWYPELDRVEKVIAKLAQGHAAYESYHQPYERPKRIAFAPLLTLGESDREQFNGSGTKALAGWPEIGTRSFYRACGERPDGLTASSNWVVVQPGRYRYYFDDVFQRVKIVLSEYLACAADW